ncbi:hypothetical protein [Palleronia sp.]|uniref:DUF7168 domain-containing protein n=1 Tax=Palleronia sp. TaxID=1940284 RepID=UPI0035C7B0F3
MPKNRNQIIELIRNLRAKAQNAASSESETIAASQAAARLLMQHDITEAELAQIGREGMKIGGFDEGRKLLHPILKRAWFGISKLTETKAWNDQGTLRFAGLESDVEMAVYLAEMIQSAGERSWKTYRQSCRRAHRLSYMLGFGTTISNRLKEMADQRNDARGTGTALVVQKAAMIDELLSETSTVLVPRRKTKTRVCTDDYKAGGNAGSKVNLGRPVGRQAGATARIA